jgi:hypothetical protein
MAMRGKRPGRASTVSGDQLLNSSRGGKLPLQPKLRRRRGAFRSFFGHFQRSEACLLRTPVEFPTPHSPA